MPTVDSLSSRSVAPRSPTRSVRDELPVLGADLVVPLVTGEQVRYVNLDYAASAPCLRAVHETITALLPWYSSVHRGAGFASTVMTDAYDAARENVATHVGARPDDTLVFTRNTTDALNLLAAALPEDTTVVCFASEHHANLLPWRAGNVVQLPVPTSKEDALARAEDALRTLTSRHRLLAVTGASNVTGEVWPVAELAAIAHRHDARIVVDAAQLAPHRAVDLTALDADWIVLSGHKLYAPFGCGALVGRADWLDEAKPYLAGGGAVRRVTVEHTEWASGFARHEAGTPNVLGAVALATACRELDRVGMKAIEAHDEALLRRISSGLDALPGVEMLSMWGPASERIGLVAFRVDGWRSSALAAALSAEHGIGVRDGAFCAHPLVSCLTSSRAGDSSAVRASFGVGTTTADVDRFLLAMTELLTHGARWEYRVVEGRYVPAPDPRVRPGPGGGAPRFASAEPCRTEAASC
jgi:selenocysteine lyase/cysteine desulfurase